MYRYKELYTLDFTNVRDYSEIHEEIRDTFDFPAYYGRSQAKRKLRDKLGADKDEHIAMQIEDDIRSGRRTPKSAQEKALEPSAEARAIVHQLSSQQKDKYQSDIRGQVQNKDITIVPLSYFIIGRVSF